MTIGSLTAMLEQFDPNDELVIEITNDHGEAVTTHAIGFDYSEFGNFMLKVYA